MTADARGEGGPEEQAAAWLARLRANDPDTAGPFELWYCADPANADAYDRLLASWNTMGELRSPATQSRWASIRPAWRPAASVAAVFLVALIGVAILVQRPAGPSAAPHALQTGAGEMRTFALSDGSRLTLDTATAVYTEFTSERRQLRLVRGRLHLDAVPEPRPLLIETDAGSISAGGSSLDVMLDGSSTRVAVLRGGASVQPRLRTATFVRIQSGQMVGFSPTGASPPTRLAQSGIRGRRGMLAFEDAPLSKVVAAANRYGPADIVLADPTLGKLRFTGTFNPTDTGGLAQMIAAMFHLRCDQSVAGHFVLYRAP